MAFRTEALRSIGGFDVALGAGTPARGGEDIDVAVRLLLAGLLVVRQPAAVIWHRSHATNAELAAADSRTTAAAWPPRSPSSWGSARSLR